MRAYFQIFIGLLIPLSALFMLLSTLYFQLDHSLTKAIRLGVLVGLFLGISISLILALFLLIGRRKHYIQEKLGSNVQNTISLSPNDAVSLSDEETIMLLMDKEIASEVTLSAIYNQQIDTYNLKHKKEENLITAKINGEVIKISISRLTKHTAQLILSSNFPSEHIQNIIYYLKEKERSFLQY